MIIAIDGPAGSGKTTIGRMIAKELRFALVDTGLFYRAITVAARRRGIEPHDAAALARMVPSLEIEITTSPQAAADAPLVFLDGQDVTPEALDPVIAKDLATIAQIPQVREQIVNWQRAYGTGNTVMLGRDIGTVIFPNAERKFFLTASSGERVARRRRELDSASGHPTSNALVENDVEARDRADQERKIAPLRPAPDAIIVETEGKSVHQVFQEVMGRLRAGR